MRGHVDPCHGLYGLSDLTWNVIELLLDLFLSILPVKKRG